MIHRGARRQGFGDGFGDAAHITGVGGGGAPIGKGGVCLKLSSTVTISTEDERVARLFEPNASSVNERLSALRKIYETGIKTFAFVDPILPGNPENLIKKLEGNASTTTMSLHRQRNIVPSKFLMLAYKGGYL